MNYLAAVVTPASTSMPSHWDAVTAVATVVLAVVTLLMVIATVWMAWNTGRALKQNNDLRDDANLHYQQTREQDQRHHEDEFRPVLTLAPPAGVGANARANLFSVEYQPVQRALIHCPIQNIGGGLALNIRMSLRKDEIAGFGPTIELVPIAGGATFVPNHSHFVLPAPSIFNPAELDTLRGGAWVIVLEYEDIFGNRFHTLHYKNAQQPWARTGRGPAPDTTPTLPG